MPKFLRDCGAELKATTSAIEPLCKEQDELIAKKGTNVENWTSKDLRTMVKYFKVNGDPKLPKMKMTMKKMNNKILQSKK
jgi:hypothetical protein